MVEVASVTLGNVQTVDAIDAGHSNGFLRLIERRRHRRLVFPVGGRSATIVGCWARSRHHVRSAGRPARSRE
jgi:hypothetical protein